MMRLVLFAVVVLVLAVGCDVWVRRLRRPRASDDPAGTRKIVDLPASSPVVADVVRQVLEARRLAVEVADQGAITVLRASTRVSLRSWGQDIAITVSPTANSTSRVLLHVRTSASGQRDDWHEGRNLVEALSEEIREGVAKAM